MATIDDWFDDLSSGERAECGRLRNEIEAWAREFRDDHTKSWKTPWGTISTTATKGKTVIDNEDELRTWAQAHKFVAPQPDKILVGEIRKHGVLDPDTGMILWPSDVNVIDSPYEKIPGVHVESDDAFNVAIKIDGRS